LLGNKPVHDSGRVTHSLARYDARNLSPIAHV
jgi:hypothetical protein